MKFQTIPEPVDAWEWTGDTLKQARAFCEDVNASGGDVKFRGLGVEGIMLRPKCSTDLYVSNDAWLVKLDAFYVSVDSSLFHKIYEEV